jgi:hypothetical protein
MAAGTGAEIDKYLNPGECKLILKALGLYQIHLFDLMNANEHEVSDSSEQALNRSESKVTSEVIKKIHRVLEGLEKNDL